MPFHGHFQYQNAQLVEASNFVVKNTGYTASPGDIVICNSGTTGQAATFNVTLPAVGQGGPVTVINCDATTSGGTVTVVTSDGSKIDNITGTTGVTIAIAYNRNSFASDGTNWWRVA